MASCVFALFVDQSFTNREVHKGTAKTKLSYSCLFVLIRGFPSC